MLLILDKTYYKNLLWVQFKKLKLYFYLFIKKNWMKKILKINKNIFWKTDYINNEMIKKH